MIVVKRNNTGLCYEMVCRHCKSILRTSKDDKDLELVWDGREGDYFKFSCPVCEKENTISAKLL